MSTRSLPVPGRLSGDWQQSRAEPWDATEDFLHRLAAKYARDPIAELFSGWLTRVDSIEVQEGKVASMSMISARALVSVCGQRSESQCVGCGVDRVRCAEKQTTEFKRIKYVKPLQRKWSLRMTCASDMVERTAKRNGR